MFNKTKLIILILNCLTVLVLIILFQQMALAQATDAGAGYNDDKFGKACLSALDYIQGGFGALLSAVTGFAAIVASAVGGFRMAWALLVVSVGAFILQEYMEIWFGLEACK